MADCYDWSLLFALILKSQTMITRVINTIRQQDLSTQMFALQRGLVELETWAESEWFVFCILILSLSLFVRFYISSPEYKPLLLFIRNQAQSLIIQRRTSFPSPFPSVSARKSTPTGQRKYIFHLFLSMHIFDIYFQTTMIYFP